MGLSLSSSKKKRKNYLDMGKYGYSIFVGNLSRRARRDDLHDLFRDIGKVVEVDIKTGFAFVEMEDLRDAEDAVKELNGSKIEGERISLEMSKGCRDKYRDFARTGRVRYRSFSKSVSPSKRRFRSRSRGGRSRSRSRSRDRGGRGGGGGGGGRDRPYRTKHSLTVGNLSSRCSWSELKDIFRKCGKVTYTDSHQRIGEGRGEVCFDSPEDLKHALKEMDGFEINGRKITVEATHTDGSRSRSRSRSRGRGGGGGGRARSGSRSPSPKGRSRSPKGRSRSPKGRSRSPKARSRSPKRSRDSRSRGRDRSDSPRRSRSRGRRSRS